MFHFLKLAIEGVSSRINNDGTSEEKPCEYFEEQLLCKNNIIVEHCDGKRNVQGYFSLKRIHTENKKDMIMCWVPNSLFTTAIKDDMHLEKINDKLGYISKTEQDLVSTRDTTPNTANFSLQKVCELENINNMTGTFTTLLGCIFCVNLADMKSMKLFFTNEELTTGHFVVSNQENQYQIFHFPHGDMKMLAGILEDWTGCTEDLENNSGNKLQRIFHVGKNVKSVGKTENNQVLHPDEGACGILSHRIWKNLLNSLGQVEDIHNFRKHVFFAGISNDLRKETWKFLLYYYPMQSTYSERDKIKDSMAEKYEEIHQKRLALIGDNYENFWKDIQFTVDKDVVRTDSNHPFFIGPDNQKNVEKMRNILLNYAIYNPQIGYTQGMSDLLSTILITIEDEVDTFWCFAGLMQFSLFATSPRDEPMDKSLGYLRELLRMMYPEFYIYYLMQDEELSLLFCHRWLVLCFKREFIECEVSRIWEACWSRYQSDYFHIFVALAIITLYGKECIDKKMQMDTIMQHFMDLATQFDVTLVLKEARSLLFKFRMLQVIPCTLEGLLSGSGVWSGGLIPQIECVSRHRKCCLKRI